MNKTLFLLSSYVLKNQIKELISNKFWIINGLNSELNYYLNSNFKLLYIFIFKF
jgi:hypothetical protein